MEFISVQNLKEKKESEESFLLLDVRDYHEYLVSNIDGHHIPYHELENRLSELEAHKNSEVIVMCRSGNTSQDACKILIDSGFEQVISLEGGMKRWVKEVDPSLPVV
jgi:adenylyltransferase/sulfurtransferase